jgi:hypothetical protein
MNDFRDVDPAELRVPMSRPQGADPTKLQRQISTYGTSIAGMPPLLAYEAADEVLVLNGTVGIVVASRARTFG